MRVIAGEAKGHSLKRPKEPNIRPTTDLVRGAIFSALEFMPVEWTRALDLYAGTGALGIEALSRGVEEVDFVEQDSRCCSIIRANLQRTGLTERANIYCMEARKALRTIKETYSLIFLDPPYYDRYDQTIIGEVILSNLTRRQTTIVMEHSQKMRPDAAYGEFQLVKNLRHGDACVSMYQIVRDEN